MINNLKDVQMQQPMLVMTPVSFSFQVYGKVSSGLLGIKSP